MLHFAHGIQHQELYSLLMGRDDVNAKKLRKILARFNDILDHLARGEVVAKTLVVSNVSTLSGRSHTSAKSGAVIQVAPNQELGDAITRALLLIIHFDKVMIAECKACRKLLVQSRSDQKFCDKACKQKHLSRPQRQKDNAQYQNDENQKDDENERMIGVASRDQYP